MKSEKLEVVKGSGNVFRDLGHKNADADLFKAILTAEIIKALDREGLSGPRCAGPHRDCGSGLLAHPQRGSWEVHRGSSDVDH
ncbi:MAG: hypothetical protein ACREA9_04080 [Pyrinomonadaceae bacterium]